MDVEVEKWHDSSIGFLKVGLFPFMFELDVWINVI